MPLETGFSYNYELASKKFKTAIDEIDKTISHLNKTKAALLSSENKFTPWPMTKQMIYLLKN